MSGTLDYAMNQALKTVLQDLVEPKELENDHDIPMTFSFTSKLYHVNGYLYTTEDKNWCQLERKTMFGNVRYLRFSYIR